MLRFKANDVCIVKYGDIPTILQGSLVVIEELLVPPDEIGFNLRAFYNHKDTCLFQDTELIRIGTL